MAGREQEEKVRRPATIQRWRALTFLHWRYEPASVQRLLPAGLEVDTWDGSAWVSLTPFLMVDIQIADLPPVPMLSTFPETNLRTYVRGPDGRDGLWFLSLEADSLAARPCCSQPLRRALPLGGHVGRAGRDDPVPQPAPWRPPGGPRHRRSP